MPALQVYGKTAENPSRNGEPSAGKSGKSPRTDNIPEDPVFDALLEERIVGYHPLLSRALKLSEDVPKRLKDRQLERAVIYLSNLLYWTPKSTRRGWLYKSVDDIEAETDLSRRAQDGARELLRTAGVIEERRRREIYYRIRWGRLKPLLRLAIQARHVERGEGCGDQVRHVEHSGKDRHVEQRTKYDMSSAEKDRHVERASSVSTRQDEHPVQVQSSSAPESANGSGASKTSPEMDDEENLVSVETKKSRSTTLPSESETSGRSGGKGMERESGPAPRRNPRGFTTLPESMIEAAISRSADELSEEAATIGQQLCEDLGRPYASDGLAVRLAEECIQRGCPEAIGAVSAKASGDTVRSPDGYLRAYVKGEINECKDHLEPGGDSVARFWAARETVVLKAAPTKLRGSGDAPLDEESRRSLVPEGQTPVFGVRRPELERSPEDYFKRGGRGARGGQE